MSLSQEIAWGDGSGDKIYITAGASEGNQTVQVSSDPNTGAARTKTITFSASGVSPVTLTVNQEAGTPSGGTYTGHPTSYDANDYSWYSTQNLDRGYADSDSTDYAGIYAKRGNNAETWIYYKFDTSSIPSNAVIKSVTCKVKASYNANNTIMPIHTVQLYSGTTAKGSATTLGTSASEKTLSVGDWTRQELNDVRVKLYLQRSTTQATTSYAGRFYGATLTVEYE